MKPGLLGAMVLDVHQRIPSEYRANRPVERGVGAPHPDSMPAATKEAMARGWADAEAAEERARAAALEAYDNLKNGRK